MSLYKAKELGTMSHFVLSRFKLKYKMRRNDILYKHDFQSFKKMLS